MSKYKNDRLLWDTICETIPQASEDIKEIIYNHLYNKVWSIDAIEEKFAQLT